jgi:hypothetical protein
LRSVFLIVLVLTSLAGFSSGKSLTFSPSFVSDFEQAWHDSRLVKTDRSSLHEVTVKLFDTNAPPRFPGLASMLLDDAIILDSTDSIEAAHEARQMACLVSDCPAPVHWQLMTYEAFAGNGLNVLGHFSGLVIGLVDLFRWIGGPFSLITVLTLAFVLGALLFVVLVILRHAYALGVALGGRLPFISGSAFALLPFLVMAYALHFGGGVLSVFLGGLLVLPVVTRREALMVCGCAGLFVGMTGLGSVPDGSVILNRVPAKLDYFTTSTQQRANLNPTVDTAILERQLSDDLRFTRLGSLRRVMSGIRKDHPGLLNAPVGAGIINLEGVGHALVGEHAEALVAFAQSASLVPDRFEPLYNQIKLLKSLNRDDETLGLLSKALSLDASEMGNRIAADFDYHRDLEGFVFFSSVPFWHTWGASVSVASVSAGVDCALWILDTSFRGDLAMAVFVLLLIAAFLSQTFFRERMLFLPCSSCGEGTLQSRTVYEAGVLDCELCRLDVTSASRLARDDLHRHTVRVSFWSFINRLIEGVGIWGYPGLNLLQTRAPVRAFLFGVCFIIASAGIVLSIGNTSGSSWALETNVGLLGLIWLSGVLIVRQRERS